MDKRKMFEWDDRTLTKYKGRAKHINGIPEWIYTINSYAFFDNKTAVTIEIPDSVYFIEMNAFCGCIHLESIKLSSNLDRLDVGLFRDCSSLKTIVVPDSVKDIASFVWKGCSNLESIEIGNNVRRIGCRAFEDCVSLKSVTIPESVDYIEENVFKGCKGLRGIHLKNDCYLEEEGINLGIRNFATCVLYVPSRTEDAFRSHPYFSKFKNIIPE